MEIKTKFNIGDEVYFVEEYNKRSVFNDLLLGVGFEVLKGKVKCYSIVIDDKRVNLKGCTTYLVETQIGDFRTSDNYAFVTKEEALQKIEEIEK